MSLKNDIAALREAESTTPHDFGACVVDRATLTRILDACEKMLAMIEHEEHNAYLHYETFKRYRHEAHGLEWKGVRGDE